ncbi:MAG TPA: MFS transporter [Pirellulales bacterium]|jgi:MFS family permease|nr:MFS transporter [Pirellulales bacterium]
MTNTPPPPKPAKWLNSTVLGIGLATLCSDVGHEMATTVLPAFLTLLGGNSALLGLIEGSADGLSSFSKLLSGWYSDRLPRRKPLAVAGYLVTASGMASFTLATQWWHVLIGRTCGWIGRGVGKPVRNVLLTEATSPETYGRAFGFRGAMDSAGAVIGPLLATAIVARSGVRSVFVWTLVPGILAALLIVLCVREREHPAPSKTPLWGGLKSLPVPFRRYLFGIGIAGIGDFSNTLLILWATQAWTPELGLGPAAQRAMLFYVGYNVVFTFACYASGWLADRFPKYAVLSIGYSLALIPAIALATPGTSLAKFAVVFVVSGLYMGVWETLENATAAELLPAESRGVGFGMLATVNGLGDFVSSALVGVLWSFTPAGAMTLVAVTSLVGSAIIFRTGRQARVTPAA